MPFVGLEQTLFLKLLGIGWGIIYRHSNNIFLVRKVFVSNTAVFFVVIMFYIICRYIINWSSLTVYLLSLTTKHSVMHIVSAQLCVSVDNYTDKHRAGTAQTHPSVQNTGDIICIIKLHLGLFHIIRMSCNDWSHTEDAQFFLFFPDYPNLKSICRTAMLFYWYFSSGYTNDT